MLALLRLEKVARLNGRINDPVFQDKLTQITFDVQDGASAYERIAQIMRTGGSFGSEVSVLKIWATETCQRVTELLLEASGDAGMMLGDVGFGEERVNVLHPFMDCRAFTIYGGSNQIQRNILVKSVLNLPT